MLPLFVSFFSFYLFLCVLRSSVLLYGCSFFTWFFCACASLCCSVFSLCVPPPWFHVVLLPTFVSGADRPDLPMADGRPQSCKILYETSILYFRVPETSGIAEVTLHPKSFDDALVPSPLRPSKEFLFFVFCEPTCLSIRSDQYKRVCVYRITVTVVIATVRCTAFVGGLRGLPGDCQRHSRRGLPPNELEEGN